MTVDIGHFLTLSAILFTLGIFGIFLNRKNVIVILMSIELILLVAMIGAIVLTLRYRPGVRRQSISRQNARTAADAMALVDVKPGEGA